MENSPEIVADRIEAIITEILKIVAVEKKKLHKLGKYTNKQLDIITIETIDNYCEKRKCNVKLIKKIML